MKLLLRALVALFKLIFRRRVKPLKYASTSPGDPYRTAVEEDEVTLPSEPAPKPKRRWRSWLWLKRRLTRLYKHLLLDDRVMRIMYVVGGGVILLGIVLGVYGVLTALPYGMNKKLHEYRQPLRVKIITSPDGTPAILLSGATGRQHLIKASKLCPRGYTVKLTVPETLLVRCKK